MQHKHVPVIGVTGPPGAGKSTVVDALIKQFTGDGKKLAILCVDPSSSFHSGAILGDRIRMNHWFLSVPWRVVVPLAVSIRAFSKSVTCWLMQVLTIS